MTAADLVREAIAKGVPPEKHADYVREQFRVLTGRLPDPYTVECALSARNGGR